MKITKKGKRWLSLLLTAAMLITLYHIPAQAETTQDAGEEQVRAQGTSPANPIHHCTGKDDGTDTTDWSYVYFGSYPQTEVTGSALTAAITGAGYDSNGDAWVNGTKYRRISKSDTNNDGYFGGSEYRYFKWERIKWRVLSNDGSTLFVMADKGLDCKDYHEEDESITWENCTLRNWLNNSFYQTAFSSAEQGAVVPQNVVNDDNPEYGTEGGNNTTDKVYLLSIGEATNPSYGFCKTYNTWSASRRLKASDYAHTRGAYRSAESYSAGNYDWWLRSPGYDTYYAANVSRHGYVDRTGSNVNDDDYAVVPALHINLSSDLWSLADDGSSGEGGGSGTGEFNPVHHCTGKDDGTDATDWSYVYFGSYPQTEVTGSALTAAVIGAGYDTNGDAWVNGTKYRRISKSDTNNGVYFGDSEYRYFKWERIKWRVLSNNGSTLFVMADKGLDCKDYNEEYTSITWENCTLRSWLNNTFYQTAFDSAEQGAVVPQNVVNDDNPEYGTEGGNNTTDKVYLLSIGEATNPLYGFCKTYDTWSASRRLKASDYAYTRGAYRDNSSDYAGNCWWWLRSPGDHTNYAANVKDYGYVNRYSVDVCNYYGTVVPALHINLSSDLWSLEDDGSSGEGGGSGTGEFNPIHHCTGKDDGTDATEWSYVYFGSYPQTEVTGSALTAAITGAGYDTNGDAWVNGTKYRRISKSDTNYDGYFGDSAYRYFKWERIKWRVLSNDGSTLFVAADKGLDCKDYHEEDEPVTWENCTLRSWLNNSFYQTAFSSAEQGAVVPQNVVNDDNPEYGTEGGNNTTDKVYLLSIGEATNPSYGFCKTYNTWSASRRLKASDYAHTRGVHRSVESDSAGSCLWWLRSPGCFTHFAALVILYGYVDSYGNNVYSSTDAVVPALHIDLSSDLWSLEDDPVCTEHNWSEATVTRPQTCTENGQKTYTCTLCGETKTEEIAATGHRNTEVRNKRDAVCSTNGYSGDVYCRDCNAKIESGRVIAATGRHTYQTVVTKATTAKNGNLTEKCTVCGEIKSNRTIPAVKSAALKTTCYTYNGKAKKPSVTVKDSSGKVISSDNYTVAYQNNVKVGKAAVTIKLKGNYEGTLTGEFTICPKGTSVSGKIAAKSKGLTVKWKKQSKSTTGYQIQISTNKKFAKNATMTKNVKKNTITKLTVKKLKPKKKYYVRIRTYKTVKGEKYVSGWSKVKAVTTKK